MLSVVFALGLLAPVGADTVTLESLLDEMVDRNEIARLADPGKSVV